MSFCTKVVPSDILLSLSEDIIQERKLCTLHGNYSSQRSLRNPLWQHPVPVCSRSVGMYSCAVVISVLKGEGLERNLSSSFISHFFIDSHFHLYNELNPEVAHTMNVSKQIQSQHPKPEGPNTQQQADSNLAAAAPPATQWSAIFHCHQELSSDRQALSLT